MKTMDKQHTPGPWESEEGPQGTTSICANVSAWTNSTLGGSVVVASVPAWPCCRDEERANVRLISASPDMFQALQDVIESIHNLGLKQCYGNTFGGTYTQDVDCPCTLCKCRAAIAKATA